MNTPIHFAFSIWFLIYLQSAYASSQAFLDSGYPGGRLAKRLVPRTSRSACPGLNTLANEGFLPKSGHLITAAKITVACFRGFGLSPETCAFIVLSGLRSASLSSASVFSLHDVDRSTWQIQHTRSLSREDIISPPFPFAPPQSTSLFQQRPWNVALRAMHQCKQGRRELINADCFGRARAARIRDRGLPYDESAATHGAVETARIMLVLGDENGAELKYIESVFVHERLPTHLGWKRKEYSGGVNAMLDAAVQTQQADIILRCPTGGGRVATRWDLLNAFTSYRGFFLNGKVKILLKLSGFNNQTIFDTLNEIAAEKRRGQIFQADEDPNECSQR
ncbi:hypothetical protein CDD83_8549 [Cordyceps sp. RAO-2017]|nr:hypothetical protein CDD83_8549 [Cordyceps sp. RAO-2017]